MRNTVYFHEKDWQAFLFDDNNLYQIRFSCPVVYYGDIAFLEIKASKPCTIVLNGTCLIKDKTGTFQIPLDKVLNPDENLLQIYGPARPAIRILTIPHSHFFLHENGAPTLSCTTRALRDEGTILVSAQVKHAAPGDVIRYILQDENGNAIDSVEVPSVSRTPTPLLTGKPRLWQGTKDPVLYTIVAQLLQQGTIRDEVRAKTGIRVFSINEKQGFLLNEKPIAMKGCVLNEPVTRQDLEDLVSQNYTCIWNRTKQPDPAFYNWCDQTGLILLEEVREDFEQQLAIAQNNASLCIWTVPATLSFRQMQQIRTHDPCRLLVAEINEPTDIDSFADLYIVTNPDIDSFHASMPDKMLAWHDPEPEERQWLWVTLKGKST